MIRPAPRFACLNTNHTLVSGSFMHLLIRLTHLAYFSAASLYLMPAGWFGRTMTSIRDDPTRNVDICASSTVEIR